jgi:ABC-2 type transport system ATP-binding protein
MRQRLGIAQALLHEPDVVFLDEPVSSLDPEGRRDVLDLIAALRGETTVILSTHVLSDVERVCDRVAIVDHGRVLASGRLDDLLGESTVRIRVTDLEATAVAALGRFGPVVSSDDGWLSIAGIDHDAIPDVVTAIVAAGGRVHAVDPGRATLEDRYMELVAGVARPRAPGPVDAGVRV